MNDLGRLKKRVSRDSGRRGGSWMSRASAPGRKDGHFFTNQKRSNLEVRTRPGGENLGV